MKKRYVLVAASVLAAASLFGFRRCGEGLERWFSTNPAPDVRGAWQVTYDDSISVEVEVGGQTYDGTISGESGTVSFTYNGEPVTLNLDCSRAWVVCPSEIWATTVTLEQRQFQDHPHQVHMTVNSTDCAGATRLPDESAGECDADDPNRPCDVEICDNVVEETKTTIGSLSDPGETTQRHPDFDIELALGGGFAVPTPNCVLASWSLATANVLYTGDYDVDAPSPEMEAYEMTSGVITTGYAGACFWFEETAYTEEVKAALLAATVRLRTGFTAQKLER